MDRLARFFGPTSPKSPAGVRPRGVRAVNPNAIRPLLALGERLVELSEKAAHLPRIDVDDRTAADLELLGNGGFTPLDGFMARADYDSVVERMRLADGRPWSLPITLAVATEQAERLPPGAEVALWHHGRPIAVLRVRDRFTYDRAREAKLVFRTEDTAHPGVAALMRQGDVYLGGPVEVIAADINTSFGRYRFTPAQVRASFERRGWRRIVAFQTRNPIHRAHEYLNKCALEMVDGLLIHPLVGETKGDDIPADVRMRCYEALLEKYYPPDRTMLAVFPAAMRYAGPREAIFHALVRRNYGCTHFIVGRDHAGVGNYYGTYDAQLIFNEFEEGELGITPVFFEHTFYCKGCGNIASDKTCVHDPILRVAPSGTKVRQLLRDGKALPPEFSRPEVARILLEAYHPELREERETREKEGAVKRNRVVIIGLDCAAPQLVFEQFRERLPHLSRLMSKGAWGELRSCDPPITVPAWSCMTSSKDPGQLGIYGFRNRRNYSYDDLVFANSSAVKEKRVWDFLTESGKKCIVLGVPGTYPPTPLEGGHMVGCFMTPSTAAQYTHPPALKAEIEQVVGRYVLDVEDPRAESRDDTLRQIYDMTDKRFKLAQHLVRTKDWDFFMMVEMGPDRIHHAFWSHHSTTHHAHDPKSPFKDAILEYYVYLDHLVGELVAVLPTDTTVIVASDHGVQDMKGGICINEWLIDNGWLVLAEPRPAKPTSLSKLKVDWSRSKAWGEGGYYARVCLNVRGREPQGTIAPEDYEATRTERAQALAAIPDDEGNAIGTRVLRPDELYSAMNGVPPDLMVYFGDLTWRSVGTVGHRRHVVYENDTGTDDANHHPDGIFIMAGPGVPADTRLSGLRIYDVAPTVLRLFGEDIPADLQGRVLFDSARD